MNCLLNLQRRHCESKPIVIAEENPNLWVVCGDCICKNLLVWSGKLYENKLIVTTEENSNTWVVTGDCI